MEGLTYDNEVFRLYATYGSIVLLKMMSLSLITGYHRRTKKAFMNPEDAVFHGHGSQDPQKFLRTDPDVERVRRCHRNDMENIPPFLIIGLLYVLSDPSVFAAMWHFRVFAAFRFLHMFAYLFAIPQPARALGFLVGWFTTLSMAVQVLKLSQF